MRFGPIRVLVAMSGGVDSSVAALLMKKKGYEVIGAFMKNWSDSKTASGRCSWRKEREYALKVGSILNIPLLTLDFEQEYRDIVFKDMIENYRRGRTPNPDILCNEKIKFPLLWKAAKKLGCKYIVTGHYARIKKNKNQRYELWRAKDERKDQSYFLYRLNQEDLSHSLFPVGEYTKTQIRKIAKDSRFPNYNKKSTVGICFIGKVSIKSLLQKYIKPRKGLVFDPDGRKIGEHDGIFFYTTGQRIGPRQGIEIRKTGDNPRRIRRWYIAKRNPRRNIIVAAPEGHELLYRKTMKIKKAHWITDEPSKSRRHKLHARIRHAGELLACELKYNRNTREWEAILCKKITGLSEGQAIVLYQKKKVLGGGVIRF